MRLVDLHPEWWAPPGRHGVAVVFDCPHCVAAGITHQHGVTRFTRLCCSLNPPLDGGAPIVCGWRELLAIGIKESTVPWCIGCEIAWARKGTTFEDLTLSPSVDASRAGHWHGFISNGAIS